MSVSLLDVDRRHVPLRLDVDRWVTRPVRKKLLAVVHTVTAGQRLLEAVQLVDADPQVQVVFTAAPDVFGHGVDLFLSRLKGLVVPWSQAVNIRFDLALAASYSGLHELHAPVIVLPHGVGHNKFVSAPTGRRGSGATPADRGVYGLSRQRLMRDGEVVPEVIVLSHEEELGRLGRECPEALPFAEVVGDPCFDRMVASLPSRALYREALSTSSRQQLVLACSTWGPESLLGQQWDLLDRLVTELPREEFQIAVLLHPNIWSTHSEWQVGSWFAGLRRSGVNLISQHADWCGPMTAADFVVGDHGSVLLYGTMTGAPLLMGGSATLELAPGSPMAELRSIAPRIHADRPLLRQLRRAAAAHRAERYAHLAARITSEPGRFARRMRALIYRKLRLRAPAVRLTTDPAPLPVTVERGTAGGVVS
ncbi:hypothetical protein ACFC0M_23815 [Streptomyces sp. NPDC056149]|uniref:hypothetical protein n=1 Tax=Streptomyces sp. NPDC056149 TaxID=3345728 RepID=UPI0035DB6D48